MTQYHDERVCKRDVLISVKNVPGVITNNGMKDAFPNILIFCPSCGTPWAEVRLIPPPEWPPRKWQAREGLCRTCGGSEALLPFTLYRNDLSQSRALLLHDFEALWVHTFAGEEDGK